MTRTAISPRLAMRTLLNTCPSGCSGDRSPYPTAVPAPARISELGRWRVERFAELDSTNRHAARRGPGGRGGRPRGRGRRPDRGPGAARPHLGGAAGVVAAGRRCCCGEPGDAGIGGDGDRRWRWRGRSSEVAGVDAGLKWPNDLVVGDRKLAGLLAERRRRRAGGRRRLQRQLGVVPDRAGRDRDRLQPGGGPRGRPRRAARPRSSTALDGAARRPGDAVVEEYRAAAGHARAPRARRARCAATTVVGIAAGVTDDGALVVRDDAGTDHTVTTADVVHLRPA